MNQGAPELYTPEQLGRWSCSAEIDGTYVLARPLGWQGWAIKKRLKLAWGVFTGKYDVLRWTGQ